MQTQDSEYSEYRNARNALIPEAEDFANRIVGLHRPKTRKEKQSRDADWTLTFLRKMDSLARERGLIN
jgi:hypothetical protein